MNQIVKLKRTTTPNNPPSTLEVGELAVGLADDPIRMWIGTATGVKRLFAGEAVEDAPDDAVYGRCNGEWVEVPIVSDTKPADPAPDSLWLDSTTGKLFVWFTDAGGSQWVEVTSAGPQGAVGLQGPPGDEGPQGATGPQGDVEEAPEDGLMYGRKDGAWTEVVGEIEEAPQDGQTYGREDGAWTPIAATPACGQFRYVSATQVGFFPFNGDAIKVAGRIYKIPPGGLTVTNAGLAATTVYYCYAYINAGNLTLEFSAVAHGTDSTPGNVGVQVRQDTNTRTLVGMVRTWNDATFFDQPNARLVASWFNRRGRPLEASAGNGQANGVGGMVWVGGDARLIHVLCWANENIAIFAVGQASTIDAGQGSYGRLSVNRSDSLQEIGAGQFFYSNHMSTLTFGGWGEFAEGYEVFGVLLQAQGTTQAMGWNTRLTGTVRQ